MHTVHLNKDTPQTETAIALQKVGTFAKEEQWKACNPEHPVKGKYQSNALKDRDILTFKPQTLAALEAWLVK